MGLISCVTSLTADMVEVKSAGDDMSIRIDTLACYVAGDTRAEQLRNLSNIAHKLLNAHDAIAAQARLFDGEA